MPDYGEPEDRGPAYKATKGGNASDMRDMARMNKIQELQRNFKLVTMFGFSAILMCSWESLLRYVFARRGGSCSHLDVHSTQAC